MVHLPSLGKTASTHQPEGYQTNGTCPRRLEAMGERIVNKVFDLEARWRQWWLSRHGHELVVSDAPRSTKELIEMMRRDYPEEFTQFTRDFMTRLSQDSQDSQYTEREIERDRLRRQADKDFGIAYSTERHVGLPAEPRRYDGFNADEHPDVRRAHDAVRNWAEDKYGPLRFLVLSGSYGNGKSHLLEAAAASLVAKGEPVLYRTDSDLIAEYRQSVARKEVEDFFTDLAEVPWLVWDDLGMAATGDAGKEIVDRLVNHRWRHQYKTLVATNLSDKGLPPRVASRLQDRAISKVINIEAPDYRKKER